MDLKLFKKYCNNLQNGLKLFFIKILIEKS